MQLGRRRMLLASAGFATAATIGGVRLWRGRSPAPSAVAHENAYEIEPAAKGRLLVRRRSAALGSKIAIAAIHGQLDVAVRGIDAAFAAIERVEAVMSIYRPESQLSRLNRAGRLQQPDRMLVEVLRYAAEMSRASHGAFDVTVQPLWQLYAEAQRQGKLPSDEQVAVACRKVDWKQVQVSGAAIHLPTAGASITLNGIAQGYAADQAMAALRAEGLEDALIDSGEFAPLGQNCRGERWSVGIQHPRDATGLYAVTSLDGRCLATSGDYATTFSADRRFNHLFDPRTGKSPAGLMSVSIVAPTALEADALSTACFVLGSERALELIRARKHCDAYFIDRNGESVATPGFPVAEGEVG